MNVSEYMEKHRLADAALPYERGDYESEADTVYSGSCVDAVGSRRVVQPEHQP